MKSVVVAVFVSAGSNAEETVFGVYSPKSAVFANAEPRDIVADRFNRVGKTVLDALGKDGDFIKGFHAKCDVDAEKRYIMHFPEDNAIISVNSAYGGNVLLGKKCFALRIASCQRGATRYRRRPFQSYIPCRGSAWGE